MHELRAFNGGAELPRAAWAATAHPFPWGIESALDGNPVTLLGMRRFAGGGQPMWRRGLRRRRDVDSVLLETSPNQPELRLELYGETAAGEWKRLDADPDIFTANVPDLRRAAVEELRRRGIGYRPPVRERRALEGGSRSGLKQRGWRRLDKPAERGCIDCNEILSGS